MKIIAVLLISLIVCGCAGVPGKGKKELSSAEILISRKDERIRELEALLAERQAQLEEKDGYIQQLKDKLRSLGVF